MSQRIVMTVIVGAALALGAQARADASADFLGSVFTGAALGAIVGAGSSSDSLVLRDGVVVDRASSGGLREEVVLGAEFFVGGLVRNGVGVDTAIQLTFGTPTDRLRFNRLQDFDRPIDVGGVANRLSRGRGHIASNLRSRARAGLLP